MCNYAMQALGECNSEEKIIRRGGDGKPYWNVYSSQFMFVPAFMFPTIPGAKEYIYTATDSEGKVHTFSGPSSSAALTPIWKDIASGMVELKVEAVHRVSGEKYLVGARSFCKMEPFPGRDNLPGKACSYKECATKAFGFVFNDEITQHWLSVGLPKPDYYHNVYPSKTYSSLIKAMTSYVELEPDKAEDAIKIAVNVADYLLSITYGEDSVFAGLPPTYSFKGLDKEIVDKNAPAADGRKHMLMIMYPASVGRAYLKLADVTGDEKYTKAAMRIAEYYKANVLPNGSWHLFVSEKTGLPENSNCCCEFEILEFLSEIHSLTGEKCWKELEKNYFAYIEKHCLESFSWEGQFEDSGFSVNYSNLTHLQADKMIIYLANNYADDPKKMEDAAEIMRFVEDQFVVWGKFAPWNPYKKAEEKWYSPAVLEQYMWYVPIDGSTVAVAKAFLAMYKATKDKLYLEKAYALADAITRMQNPDNGVIPTHWITTNCSTVLDNFWLNCHIGSAFSMQIFAEAEEELK